jgi:GAF domain-containing protein
VVGVLTKTFLPSYYSVAAYPPLTLIVGWVIFMVFALGLYASFNYLFPRLLNALQKGADLSTSLEEQQAVLAERTRALQEANTNLQRRAMYLEASTQVSQALSTIFELEILLEQAVNLIVQHFDFYRAVIFLAEEDGQSARLHATASVGGRRVTLRTQRWRAGEHNAVGMALANRHPCIMTTGKRNMPYATEVDLSMVRAEAALPLLVGDRLLGVLDVYSGEEAAFDQDDVRALQGLTGLLSVAIDNARRLGDEAAVLEAASPLYRLAHRLATTRTEREIYAAMLESLRDFNPARVFIFRQSRLPSAHMSAAEQAYLVAEMRGVEANFYDQYITAADIRHIGDLINFGVTLESSLVIGNLSATYHSGNADVDRVLVNLATELGIMALTLAPMRLESECLGVLLITYNTPHQFTPLQGQLQRVLANLATVALERIRLLHEAQTRVSRERWLREFGEQVMRIPDLEMMVAQSAQLLQDAVQADGVLLSLTPPETDAERPVWGGKGAG